MCRYKLIEKEQIGDRTPSQFHRDLKYLANLSTSDDFILTVWESRLPVHVHILASVQDKNAETRARFTDSIYEIQTEEGRFVAISEERTTRDNERQNHVRNAMEDRLNRVADVLDTRINQIVTRIGALSIDSHRRPRPLPR
jgi:hypothetical protein